MAPFADTSSRPLSTAVKRIGRVLLSPPGVEMDVNSTVSEAVSCTTPSPTLRTDFTTPVTMLPMGKNVIPPDFYRSDENGLDRRSRAARKRPDGVHQAHVESGASGHVNAAQRLHREE